MAEDILIVDDEADIRGLVADILEDEGFAPREAGDSASALAEINSRRPGLVLLDIWLQGSDMDGMGILKEAKRDHPDLPILMMSGHGNIETAVTAMKHGAYDFIEKPFKADRLVFLVKRAIEAARLKRENNELRLRAGSETELIGASAHMREIQQLLDRVGPTNSRVLIAGPSGSGKEVIARALHRRSSRKDGPFVVVNCASMTPDRMAEELFGTEDADGVRRVGTFEQAHGGTLLLDEVADMPIETQGKIVRILQEQIFERVGGTTRVTVDVRVIATSSKDLQAALDQGDFREDLYYRLNVVPMNLAPLKERREDIPLIAEFFITKAAETSGRPARAIGPDAMAALQSYDWPGNVRELRNAIERMLIMAPDGDGDPLSADLVPGEVFGANPSASNAGGMEVMGLSLHIGQGECWRLQKPPSLSAWSDPPFTAS